MLISLMPGALAWPAAMIVWAPATRRPSIVITACTSSWRCTARCASVAARDSNWLRCGAALVRPDAAHEVDARDATVLIAFIEPESPLGAALSARIERAIAPCRRPS